jgi:putative YjhG/YagF family dehydratase
MVSGIQTQPACLQSSDHIFNVQTKASGPQGRLPFTERMLREEPSGNLFAGSQNAGMGWNPERVFGKDMLILSTMGGLRERDGTPVALGYHTGHWELDLLVRGAAATLKGLGYIPFAAHCTDVCDGRSQGTAGMMDSLAYRNSAAEVLGRLIRSLPNRRGILGIATCDKGLPAMMMALANAHNLPGVLIPGGTTLPPIVGEDAGVIQSIGARFSHGEITLEDASQFGCSACASPGGGCQFLGTAATSQVIAEALGIALPHSALAPSGEPVWLELGRSSAIALQELEQKGITLRHILTPGAFKNAMAIHAAFGGSTNLLLHLPAIAYAAGVRRPTVEDWIRMNHRIPRIVDVLPNGPTNYKTVQVFLAGAVPEVMLHLREIDVLDLDCLTVSGMTVRDNLLWWEESSRRQRFREILKKEDQVDPDDVIMNPSHAKSKGLTSTVVFPTGNLAPEGSVVKSTAIDSSLCKDGVYDHIGPARVFTSEEAAIAAVKSIGPDRIQPGDVIVLICRGPLGAGMPETAQITFALKYTKALKGVALLTDGRFSGVSTGPCVGHIGPEALAGGSIGKLIDGDFIHIHIDRNRLTGTINVIGEAGSSREVWSISRGNQVLANRSLRSDLRADRNLPAAVRLFAELQVSGGGTWGGCIYDEEAIIQALRTSRGAK